MVTTTLVARVSALRRTPSLAPLAAALALVAAGCVPTPNPDSQVIVTVENTCPSAVSVLVGEFEDDYASDRPAADAYPVAAGDVFRNPESFRKPLGPEIYVWVGTAADSEIGAPTAISVEGLPQVVGADGRLILGVTLTGRLCS